jgi:hypothetical protein
MEINNIPTSLNFGRKLYVHPAMTKRIGIHNYIDKI